MSSPPGTNVHAFVTGGSGFVGRHLIEVLRARDHVVRALARSARAAETVAVAGADVVPGDLDDVAAMAAGMRGCAVVFHAAAKVAVWGRRADFERVNIAGTRHVVDAARAAGVPRIVHVSSEAVLLGGPPLIDADETWPLPAHPLGLYAWSKGQAENIVRAANSDVLTTVIVRPRAVWGPGDTTVVPRLAELAHRGYFAWVGGGRHTTSTCHVRNLCEALLLAAERGRGGETYFVTDGESVEFRAFFTEIMAAAGVDLGTREFSIGLARAAAWLIEALWTITGRSSEPPVTRTAVALAGQEVIVSDAKIRRELGYAPVVSIAQGLAELRAAATDLDARAAR